MSRGRRRNALAALYRQLRARHGAQGWWPIAGGKRRPGFDADGYHPGNHAHPKSAADRFEIIMGALLTQNTSWTNVAQALAALRGAGIRLPRDVLRCRRERLARLIRSSGYFNQKASRLIVAARYFSAPGSLSGRRVPARADLLSLWGIGPETADSILLYAFHIPTFVVDAYTRRILQRVGLIEHGQRYEEVQDLFHGALARSERLFNEFHALLVAHGKGPCTTRPACAACPVNPCAHGDRLRA